MFQKGRELMDQGRIAEACTQFEGSLAREDKLGTLLNLANCHEKAGRTATAWREFGTAAKRAAERGQDKRVVFAEAHRNHLAAQLSKVAVRRRATPLAGLVVAFDGKALSADDLATPIPVDPGTLTVTFSADGKEPTTVKLEVPPGPTEVELPVPDLPDVAAAPALPKPLPLTKPKPLPSPEPAPKPKEVPSSISPLVWAGVGSAEPASCSVWSRERSRFRRMWTRSAPTARAHRKAERRSRTPR